VRSLRLVWTFAVFHATLGIVVFVASMTTLLRALGWQGGGVPHLHHLALLAGIETLGALLFLVPPTVGVGGVLLLGTFALAIAVHLLRGEFPAQLFVYAAGTALVMVHGQVFTAVRPPDPTAHAGGAESS
jgi:hypothetical protein